ncbi:MAG: DUF2284 domain-containing protein [Deltaproteobacteria bacterium]|nr:DUF2284 domain-containing protein [Deltaproteobacteria bacterium]
MPICSDEAGLQEAAARCGASASAMVNVSDIIFKPEFRSLCKDNRCGNYGKNWKCPPAIGEIEDLIDRLKDKTRAMLFQFVGPLARPYDWKGMQAAAKEFSKVVQSLAIELLTLHPSATVLGAGPCVACEKCAYPDEPCRFPNLAVTSLEANGVDVSLAAKFAGLKYHNGPLTVTYFGAVFI